MAENREIVRSRERNPKTPNNLVSVLKNLWKLGKEEKEESPPEKPNVVGVPVAKVVAPPPLAAEGKMPGKFSHPAIRWPLYALGGFLIVRWAWKRWKSEDDEDN